jgi:Sulfotransferase domain
MKPLIPQIRHKIFTSSALRAPLMWKRHRGLTQHDVFLASYPRSGSTWLRFMMLEILTGSSPDFKKVNQLLPSVGDHSSGVPLLPGTGRLIKTHEAYRKQYKKAVYLVRDARDVVLSEYAYEKGLGRFEKDCDQFLRVFLSGKVSGYGSWQHHVHSWLDADSGGDVELLVVRFEELRRHPEETLARLTQFIGVNVDDQLIRKVVADNSLDMMKKKEDMSPQMPKGGNRFVRSGAVGGWMESLTPAQMELIDRFAGDALSRAGYRLGKEMGAGDKLARTF